MNVVFVAPNYPYEMGEFTRGLAEVGAKVWGVGSSPLGGIEPHIRRYLDDYLQVPNLFDELDTTQRVRAWLKGRTVDRVESQWEPTVLLAARIREAIGVPGMSYDTVLGFRDKQLMKERVAAAGLRVPRSKRASSAKEVKAAAEEVGFPLIIKPIAGAGSADTYRCNDAKDLDAAIAKTQHVQEVSIEEFVDGEEYTFDTVCVDGQMVYANVSQYLPRPLIARTNEWISPIIITVKDMYAPKYHDGLKLGAGVLKALGMGTGYTHMEWYRKSDGEVVFGEIGCRPGGARLVDQMNYTSDLDLYREWARTVCWHAFEQDPTRKFNAGIIFKRAMGQGRITAIHGLDEYLRKYGRFVCHHELLPVGTQRRDWKQTLMSDGYAIVRHPDWDAAKELCERFAVDVKMYAGG